MSGTQSVVVYRSISEQRIDQALQQSLQGDYAFPIMCAVAVLVITAMLANSMLNSIDRKLLLKLRRNGYDNWIVMFIAMLCSALTLYVMVI